MAKFSERTSHFGYISRVSNTPGNPGYPGNLLEFFFDGKSWNSTEILPCPGNFMAFVAINMMHLCSVFTMIG